MEKTTEGEYLVTRYADGTVVQELHGSQPATQPEAPKEDFMSKYAFRDRFTESEKIAIELAGIDNPAATAAERQRSAAVRVCMADMNAVGKIDRLLPKTRAGVQMMEAVGLIAAGRAAEILDTPILPPERPDA